METERPHVAEAPDDGSSEPRYMRSPEPRGDFGSRRSEGGSDDRPRRGPPAAGDDDRPRRRGGRRRRVCIMCADHIRYVDYKNVSFLRRFISDRARIETRRKSSACAKHQRALATAIKRARHLALLPYTAEHIRVSQGR
jgi:small subunit ribosomal protein S18